MGLFDMPSASEIQISLVRLDTPILRQAEDVPPPSYSSVPKKSLYTKVIHSFKQRCQNSSETTSMLSPELGKFSMQYIAFGGCVGTGLFVASSNSIACGPGPMLVAYAVISLLIFCMCQALGELTVAMPVRGGFVGYSSKLVDKSWGFTMAWNYCLQWMCLLPMELVAACMTFHFWPEVSTVYPDWAIISSFLLVIIIINMLSVRYYGYFEIICSLIKVVSVFIFSYMALLIDWGAFGTPIGFKYWFNPGMVSPDGWISGTLKSSLAVAFSFAGTELIGVSATESKEPPEKAIPMSLKAVIWKIVLIYLFTPFVLTLVVPFNHPLLIRSTSTGINVSPFVLAMEYFETNVLASVINAVILVAIISVANSSIYASSRSILALADNSQAPKFLKYLDKKKRPLLANLVAISFGLLAYLSLLFPRGSEQIFMWLVSLSGVSILFSYMTICICHIRFRRALAFYNISTDQLQFKACTGVYGSVYGVILCFILGLCQVYSGIYKGGSIYEKLQSSVGLGALALVYIVHKVVMMIRSQTWKTEILVPYDKIDILQGKFKEVELAKSGGTERSSVAANSGVSNGSGRRSGEERSEGVSRGEVIWSYVARYFK
ncbi:amino acid permease-domain-containing protein [Scheffersomyces xylosifermentans]|uniref:amino acid permease-domain-containing protein n=1 Tax=Scheffersomyces xylosifermentans TaxID=1304137 RepID=UPI00315DA6CE